MLLELEPLVLDDEPPEELSSPAELDPSKPLADTFVDAEVVEGSACPEDPVPPPFEDGSEKQPTNKKHAHQRQSMAGVSHAKSPSPNGNGLSA